jgi:hypothetical protein
VECREGRRERKRASGVNITWECVQDGMQRCMQQGGDPELAVMGMASGQDKKSVYRP